MGLRPRRVTAGQLEPLCSAVRPARDHCSRPLLETPARRLQRTSGQRPGEYLHQQLVKEPVVQRQTTSASRAVTPWPRSTVFKNAASADEWSLRRAVRVFAHPASESSHVLQRHGSGHRNGWDHSAVDRPRQPFLDPQQPGPSRRRSNPHSVSEFTRASGCQPLPQSLVSADTNSPFGDLATSLTPAWSTMPCVRPPS